VREKQEKLCILACIHTSRHMLCASMLEMHTGAHMHSTHSTHSTHTHTHTTLEHVADEALMYVIATYMTPGRLVVVFM
jgi:hypothetical protein